MTRRYLDGLLRFNEAETDLWALFVLNGFHEESIAVDKKHKGSSTYNLRRKLGMALNTITTLTHRPLYLVAIAGMLTTFASFAFGAWILFHYAGTGIVTTWSLLFFSIWLATGLILIALGVISVYISKMFLEVKNRPVSIIRRIHKK